MRFLAAGQGAALIEDGAQEKADVFARGVKPEFARGGQEGMPVEDDDAFAVCAREFFQALAEFQFFRRKQFVAEAAEFSERRRFAKNK